MHHAYSLAALAFAALLQPASAAILKFELDASISASYDSHGLYLGDAGFGGANGHSLRLQLAVDEALLPAANSPNANQRHYSNESDLPWLSFQLWLDGQLLSQPLPDFSGSSANTLDNPYHWQQGQLEHPTGCGLDPDCAPGSRMQLHSESYRYGYNYGSDDFDDYWESGFFSIGSNLELDLTALEASFLQAPSFNAVGDLQGPALASSGRIAFFHLFEDCDASYLSFGCAPAGSPSAGEAWLEFNGNSIRQGWSQPQLAVTASNSLPLLALGLLLGWRLRRHAALRR